MRAVSIIFMIFCLALFTVGCSDSTSPDEDGNGGNNTGTTHSSNITQDETWDSGTHIIDGIITISNAIVTIEAGATVIFKEGARLMVGTNGGLIADGTADEILFTGDVKQKGYWQYVEFRSDAIAASCVLKNVTLEYGGGYSSDSYMLQIDNNATVTNCTIRNSSSNGVWIDDDLSPTFINNTITMNDGYPVETYISSIHSVQLGSGSFLGNGKNYVLINDDYLEKAATAHLLDVPYRFDGISSVTASGVLTIEAGTTIEMNSDARLIIDDGAGLIAQGTPTDKITFTGAIKQAGYWQYIQFRNNAINNQSILNNVIIEYGGGYSSSSAQLFIENEATVTNTIIRYSGSYGCEINYDKKPIFADNQLTANTKAPLYIYASSLPGMDLGSCDFTGNSEEFIYVDDDYISTSGIIAKTNVPYRFTGLTSITDNSVVTIEPGTTIEFDSDARFSVSEGCELIADGTTEQITFTGAVKQKGYWQYIGFDSNASNNSKLINCLVEWGGGYPDLGIIVVNNSAIIQNCTIQHSSSNGIYVWSHTGSTANMSNNTFIDIDGQDYYID
ncbi:MAG: hypothetical protein Kow00108_03460 [Calditrichia bacterium]